MLKQKNNKVIDYENSAASLNKQGEYQENLLISNSQLTSKEDEFVVTVEWNGNSEDVTLINK